MRRTCLSALTALTLAAAPGGARTSTEPPMTRRITGTVDVKMNPLPGEGPAWESFGRRAIEKRYHGDLEATGEGQMLGFLSTEKGSAGYVALERVTGTLNGRKGSFVLQHSGTMARGVEALAITVVPDSGTEGLSGLSGRMSILVHEGRHVYEFEFALPKGRP